jgi:hypothetical protein
MSDQELTVTIYRLEAQEAERKGQRSREGHSERRTFKIETITSH